MSGAMFSMPGDPMAAVQVAMEEQNRRMRRDMFALHALQVVALVRAKSDDLPHMPALARDAVKLADAMIAELDRGQS